MSISNNCGSWVYFVTFATKIIPARNEGPWHRPGGPNHHASKTNNEQKKMRKYINLDS